MRQVSRMDREKAIKILTLFREEWDRHSKTPNAKALDMAIEALQEKDHRCDNCSNGENAGVRIYCLLHTSFHRLDEYCSEWRQE